MMATQTTNGQTNKQEYQGLRLFQRAQELFRGLTKDVRSAEIHGVDELIRRLEEYKKSIAPGAEQKVVPTDVRKKAVQPPVLGDWDAGVFFNEVERISRVKDDSVMIKQPISGTYNGTKRSLSQMFERIEERFAAWFDVTNREPTIPWPMGDDFSPDAMDKRRELFTWQLPGGDGVHPYPPHLRCIPEDAVTSKIGGGGAIFDFRRFVDTALLLQPWIPQTLQNFFHDFKPGVSTFKDLEKDFKSEKGDGFTDSIKTIAERDDWFCDAVFAQQAFTGTNATTVLSAEERHLDMFRKAAAIQKLDAIIQLLEAEKDNFYVLDNSYFREACNVDPEQTLECVDDLMSSKDDPTPDFKLYLPATVTLLHLDSRGRLHPLAIIIDYKRSVEKSVTIFNRRSKWSMAPQDIQQDAMDWPWRYAKMCAQVSDWVRHELTIHLTNTHLVEEATIVAANRAFSPDHPVFRLLRPHWTKTLSLNAAARTTLVPEIIEKLVGVPGPQVYNFICHAYRSFNFTDMYVPTDLQKRGFDLKELNSGPTSRFHNYGYGYNINLMWNAIRAFVKGKLESQGYANDADVTGDAEITAWCAEMHDPKGGQMTSFPTITTIDELVDAVTMCIHLASPQHTAVNYLQEYYYAFVVNKPPALCQPIPTTLEQLLKYKERDVLAATPVSRPKAWLVAAHVPHLLSPHVLSHDSLLTYALSYKKFANQHAQEHGQNMAQAADKNDAKNVEHYRKKRENAQILEAAADKFHRDLNEMSRLSTEFEKGFDVPGLIYRVLQPSETAGSILI